MKNINDGGPAFPRQFQQWDNDIGEWRPTEPEEGMTLRDYFAAKALPQVIRQCASDTRAPGESPEDYFARRSFMLADAMLKARDES